MHHGSSEMSREALEMEDGSKRPTILFLHENAGNLGLRMDYFNTLYHELGYNVLAFAYRGYSDSTLQAGFPSESSL